MEHGMKPSPTREALQPHIKHQHKRFKSIPYFLLERAREKVILMVAMPDMWGKR
jgi:hypothetical protein